MPTNRAVLCAASVAMMLMGLSPVALALQARESTLSELDAAISVAESAAGYDPSAELVQPMILGDAVGVGLVEPGGAPALEVSAPHFSGAVNTRTARGRTMLASEFGSVTPAVSSPAPGITRLMAILADETAPESFEYDLNLKPGDRIEQRPDGGLYVWPEGAIVAVEVDPAWAVDATGAQVPTRYHVDGDRIVQKVDHRGGQFQYPIVADPSFRTRAFGSTGEIVFNRSETEAVATGGPTAAAAILGGCAFVAPGPFKAACAALGVRIALDIAYFAAVNSQDRCAQYFAPLYSSFVPEPTGNARGEFGCF